MRSLKAKITRRSRRRGFTLMEVLLVLAILVILGSIVTVSVIRMQRTAYIDAAKSQLQIFDAAITQYQLHIGTVPSDIEALVSLPQDIPNQAKWQGPYLGKQLPSDPWDQPYQYEMINDESFHIFSSGPDRQPQTDDDINL
ncbi:type II secretion system major pseudopilin GspG [Anatilimnocola sp. NA78]|uniref:type II secretion system major pseudopilin GspG n=1 Tax=Anatilimnocola sp. NA78 TaxID=3415683 RepID=UPI003CE4EA57